VRNIKNPNRLILLRGRRSWCRPPRMAVAVCGTRCGLAWKVLATREPRVNVRAVTHTRSVAHSSIRLRASTRFVSTD